MKVILTGVTGFIGSEVLTQCCKNPAITSIIALSRRPLSTDITKDPRVEIIVLKDFTAYSKEVIEQLEGADACIWYVSAFLARNGNN
jgi:nucleoside-diphosphate-sugar epimerase